MKDVRELQDLLSSLRTQNGLVLELFEPLSTDLISQFERKAKGRLPQQLADLYQLSNGLVVDDDPLIAPMEELVFYQENGLWSFHDWGSGDYDCIAIDDVFSENSVLFVNHSQENCSLVDLSLLGWLKKAIAEISLNGNLLHPIDFFDVENNEGMYKRVFEDLIKKNGTIYG